MSLTLTYASEHSQPFLVFGEKIKGSITLETNKTLKNCEYLQIVLVGFENVHWSEQCGKNSRIHFRNHRVLFQIPLILWKSNSTKEDIQQGKFVFGFTLQLPFIQMSSSLRHHHGQVEYHLYSFLSQGNNGVIDSVLSFFGVFKGIKVDQALNIIGSQATQQILDDSKYYLKKTGVHEKTFFFKTGKMIMTCSMQKSIFFDGEDVIIDLFIQNGTSAKADYFEIQLQEIIHFKATNKTSFHTNNLLNLKVSMNIAANKDIQASFKVTLPKGLLESTFDPNCIVSRNYNFIVKVPCGIVYPKIVFGIIIINSIGCPLRSQLIFKN